jgi:uncharacterized membrane protein YagU involved in acid resistance
MPRQLDWKAAVSAGLIAGLIFLILELALVAFVQGESPWGPPRMIAAIAMGEEVLPPPATFEPAIVAVGMLVHFGFAIVLGVVFAALHRLLDMSLPTAIAVGIIFALAVYFIDFYLFTAVFPWFAMARNWMSILAHIVFGATLGWTYHALARRVRVQEV